MKKIILILIICFLASPLHLFADDEKEESSPFRMKDRTIEIGLANISFGFANDFLTTSQILQDKVVINLRELDKGFRFNLDLDVTPFYFSYNNNNDWGFGLAVGTDVAGAFDFSGNMLSFSEGKKEKSDVSAAVFIDVKASSFFPILNFKTKANLSVFYPAIYVEPNISYSLANPKNGASEIDLLYQIKVFTPMSMADGASSSLTSAPGVDIHLGVEYPLSEVLGLNQIIPFLDFIVGVDLINIPIVPSSMKDYMEISGRINSNGPIKIDDFEDYMEINEDEYYSKKTNITRPFKMLAWADWKPFPSIPVSFIPTIGFAINPMYSEPGSMEGGIKARFDLANIFIATLGTGYHDRLWKNSIDLALNLRVFELNLGVDFRSQDFAKSWTGGGFGLKFGLKFGG